MPKQIKITPDKIEGSFLFNRDVHVVASAATKTKIVFAIMTQVIINQTGSSKKA